MPGAAHEPGAVCAAARPTWCQLSLGAVGTGILEVPTALPPGAAPTHRADGGLHRGAGGGGAQESGHSVLASGTKGLP